MSGYRQTQVKDAVKVFEGLADERIVKKVSDAVAAGTLTWIADPQVDGVFGLAKSSEGFILGGVVAIVYVADEDFEIDEEYFA